MHLVRVSRSASAHKPRSSSNEREVNNVKMSELNGISQAARDARRRLEETLRIAHDTELELRSKIGLKAIQVRHFGWMLLFFHTKALNSPTCNIGELGGPLSLGLSHFKSR